MLRFINRVIQLFFRKSCEIYNWIVFKRANAKIGTKVCVNGKIKIYGMGKLIIDNNVTINSDIKFAPIGGQSGCSFLIKNNAEIYIHEGAGLSNVAICAFAGVEIGKDVFIGGDCKIYDTDFHSLQKKHRLSNPDLDINSKKIHIMDGAFIGGGSIILKGVTIGENSVIGAGSVVSKDIPPNQIWAGNPIRFIKNIND